MNQIPNLSPAAEQALTLAVNESRHLQHHFIGTEHIFNALCKSDDGAVQEAFARARLDPLIRREIRRNLIPGIGQILGDQMLFTPRAHRLLNKSQEMVGAAGGSVEPINLLVTLLQAGEGVAVRLLRRLQQDPEKLRSVAEEILTNPEIRSRSKTPFLNSLGRDLSALALEGRLDPVVGRRQEVQQMAQTLLRKKKNNVLLVGDAGVGKTSLVESLAMILTREGAPAELRRKRLIEVSIGALVSGTKYRGDLEQRVQRLLAEAQDPEIILFVDEFHTVMNTTGADGAPDIANMLKPVLASGQLRLIGATTWKEYRSFIEPDAAFERRFQVIDVKELSLAETIQVLQKLSEVYARYHQVSIAPEAVEAAVAFSVRFVPERRLPDKAIDLIDQACAQVRLQRLGLQEAAEAAAEIQVGVEDVAAVVANWAGVPLEKVMQRPEDRFLHLEESLKERIKGQSEAIRTIAASFRLAQVGLASGSRPQAAFLFIGPTGVGKTETARVLAETLMQGRQALVRLDMSEFMEKHAVAKLVGSPPGYVGYGDEGQLTGPVRRRPNSVVLFDEVEKAHPEIMDLLLQVLDAGHLTDSKGRRINFRETIIIFTSNIAVTGEGGKVGFMAAGGQPEKVQVDSALRRHFRPEFLNRLDKKILFQPLGQEICRELVAREVAQIAARLQSRGVSLQVEESVTEIILSEANYRVYGARELKRTVNCFLAEPLSQWLLEHPASPSCLRVSVVAGEPTFAAADDPRPEPGE